MVSPHPAFHADANPGLFLRYHTLTGAAPLLQGCSHSLFGLAGLFQLNIQRKQRTAMSVSSFPGFIIFSETMRNLQSLIFQFYAV